MALSIVSLSVADLKAATCGGPLRGLGLDLGDRQRVRLGMPSMDQCAASCWQQSDSTYEVEIGLLRRPGDQPHPPPRNPTLSTFPTAVFGIASTTVSAAGTL
jgi:hypothetical protein